MLRVNILVTIFIPLMLALLITIFIPTSIMLAANPRQEAVYRNLKLRNEQIFTRNLLSQDQRVIEKRLQDYENIRNTLLGIFLQSTNSNYQSYNGITLLSAENYAGDSQSVSMWLSTNNPLTTEQTAIFNRYIQVEPYMRAILPQASSVIEAMVWTFTSGLLFAFPAQNNTLSANPSIYSQYHNETLINYNTYQQEYTIFSNQSSILTACNVLIDQTAIGTVCLQYNGNSFFSTLFSLSVIPSTTFLSNIYFLQMMTPNQTVPNLMMTYEPGNDTSLTFYTDQPINIQANLNIYQDRFLPNWYYNTSDNLQIQVIGSKAYYQSPVMIWTQQLKKVPFFIYVISSDEVLQQISSNFLKERLVPILVTPTVLFFISCLLSWYILTRIVNKLAREFDVIIQKSNLLLKGDLEIQIPDYQGTLEIKKIYESLKILNELVKFSQRRYFQGNNSQKSIKYYRALGFFTQLNHRPSIGFIHENLAGLSYNQRQFSKSMQQSQMAMSYIEQQMIKPYPQFKNIKQMYVYLRSKGKKMPKQLHEHEVILMRRYFSFIEAFYLVDRTQEQSQKLIQHIQTLLLILKNTPYDQRYIRLVLKLIDLVMQNGDFQQAKLQLDYCQSLIFQYDRRYNQQVQFRRIKTVDSVEKSNFDRNFDKAQPTNQYPPQILYQSMLYLLGRYHECQEELLKAFHCYKDCFDGDYYSPLVRKKLQQSFRRMLISENLFTRSLKDSVYFHSEDMTANKEYVFVLDNSTSMRNYLMGRDETRQQLAIYEIIRMFDQNITDGDRVSLVKFSDEMQVVFNLTEKGRCRDLLRQSISSLKKEEPDGRTALYSTLKVVLTTIQHLKKLKILVIIVDGVDNCSKVTLSEIQNLILLIPRLKVIFLAIEMEESQLIDFYEMVQDLPYGYVVDILDRDYVNRIIRQKAYRKCPIETYVC